MNVLKPISLILLLPLCLTGCGSDDEKENSVSCDSSINSVFEDDELTQVLLTHEFKKGDVLKLDESSTTTQVAENDLCVVKLLVGPGNPGPEGAPSTSAGIGIEIWLPSRENWNNRIHVLGGGGWAGGVHTSLTNLAGVSVYGNLAEVASIENSVSASTDTGHVVGNGAFAMKPDGSINRSLWDDFSYRGIHEMAVKTKILTAAYYAKEADYSYWDGFSTGGRQGHQEAQVNPNDFDGILAGAPAINWTNFITNELYPLVVIERDLGGMPLSMGQLTLAGNKAIDACDDVGGIDLGYITDPESCNYDPTLDVSLLCTVDGGVNATDDCFSMVQATAMNKIWYGQTTDGTVPSPSEHNGYSSSLNSGQRWFGLPRGTFVALLTGNVFGGPFSISSDMVALELQDARYATPAFVNATNNGDNLWKELTYSELNEATFQGISLQLSFGDINTDNPDLRGFKSSGGKLLTYHGMADTLIAAQGTIHYYESVINEMGGLTEVNNFYKLFMVPAMAHGFSNGTTNPGANPPLPTQSQLFDVLVDWVENGVEPNSIEILSQDETKSRPICAYPTKAIYNSGDANQASSYSCQ